nr:MAG TPA: hypothetical protein [Herelleviridae sp.]
MLRGTKLFNKECSLYHKLKIDEPRVKVVA